MTGQGDVAGRLVETAARADFCRSHSADESAWQRLSEESRDFYRDQTAERLADMLPPLADHVEACADSSTPLRGYGIRDAATLLRDLAVRVAR